MIFPRLKNPYRRILILGLVLALFALLLALNFSRVVRADYGHDEDQFIASAWLTAHDGLLPYRDYAYFHTPYLVFVYAALFRLVGGYPLLTARLFSALCASAGMALFFFLAWDFFCGQPRRYRLGAAVGFTLLFALSPLTAAASGFSWNHDAMLLLLLLAFAALYHAPRRAHPRRWLFASGVLLGLAIGVRASAVTVLPAFLLALWFFPGVRSLRRYFSFILLWGGGMALALVPLLVTFLLAPRQFLFGNIEYALLNTRFRLDTPVLYDRGFPVYGPRNFLEKLGYLGESVIAQPSNLLAFLLLAFFGWTAMGAALRRKAAPLYETTLLLLLAPLACLGSLLPTPSWMQYFYAPLPFALLAAAYGLAMLTRRGGSLGKWTLALLVWVVLLTNLYQSMDYRRLSFVRYPELWKPLAIHQLGDEIRQAVGEGGRVFTLSPLYPLEAGVPIYSQFATGTFAYRTGVQLTPEQRRFYKVVSEGDLAAFLEADPPAAILIGLDPLLDPPIQEYAQSHGYQKRDLTVLVSLWLRP